MPNQNMPDLDAALNKMPGMKQSNVTEDMTSAGRLDKMLKQDSPLMKRARTQGLQQAQQRGLLNSSMAAGAAQGAMIDRAQPFALQDSNNLIQNQQFNVGQRNQRGLLQASLIGDSYKSNQNYAQQLGLNEQAYGFERDLAELRQGYQQDNMRLGDEIQQGQMELQNALNQGDMRLANELQQTLDAKRQEYEQNNMRLADSLQQGQMELQNALNQGNMELANQLQQKINEQQFGFQTQRDETLSGYDQDMARLQQELQEAQAANDFGREQDILEQQAGIQQQRDELLFGQQLTRDERLNNYQSEQMRLDSELAEARASSDFGRETQLLDRKAQIDRDLYELQFANEAERDERLAGFDQDMARLGQELQEAQAANDFGRQQQLTEQQAAIQAERDQTLFSYDMQNVEAQAEIQAARDVRLSELDADAARLQQELQEAQAQNDFGRTKEITDRQAEIQETRDQLLFAQNMESMVEEYGLRDELAQSEADRAMREMFATSQGNAWGVMANNLTDLVAQSSAEIQQIQMNPNITAEDKEAMIADVIERRDTDLAFQQSMYNSLSDTLLNSGAFPTQGLNTPIRQQISDIYRQELGREPDQVGLDYWAQQARNLDVDKIRYWIRQEAGGAA